MVVKQSNTHSRSLGAVAGRRFLDQMPQEERPEVRARNVGLENLAAVELLALVLSTVDAPDLARDVLAMCHRLADLTNLSVEELTTIPGLSEALALRILAASELGRRLNRPVVEDRPKVTHPDQVAALVQDMMYLQQEQLRVLLVNARNIITEQLTVCIGTPYSVDLRPADVLQPVIARRASAFILVHNHPSGDYRPSGADVQLTLKLGALAEEIGVWLLDHIIIAAQGYTSLRASGMLTSSMGIHGGDNE